MAHVLDAYMSLWSRDINRVRQARAAHARTSRLPATARELLHHAAIGAALRDDFEMLRALLDDLLERYPRDILALHAGHALDYLTGDLERMALRVPSVIPEWSADLPGFHSLLAMQAFSAVECARYELAHESARQALELNPWDARAHHALAHALEMTGASAAGLRWMRERTPFWSVDTVAAIHCWWHSALFHLELGDREAALELYDRRVRAACSPDIADLIDASALLWRIELQGGDAGRRWLELARAWEHHLADGYCSFNDLHAMLAFAGAEDWHNAKRLEARLLQSRELATRYGETTRIIGLPACRGMLAYRRGDFERAAELLGIIPALARRIGGSHAQRDIMSATLAEAVHRGHRRRLREAAA
ncbi:MAG TPA: hypothetical protein VHE11_04210 [Steroidobacteraceae bacterium]|nr:hypothetical protein [Steroidobacteraceae bacterium]